MNKVFFVITILLLVDSALVAQKEIRLSNLRFLDELTIEFNKSFGGTKIGGLSGIDYDRSNQTYYLITDDDVGRLYKAKIHIYKDRLDSINFFSFHALSPGLGYIEATNSRVPDDVESIRLNGKTKELIWTSEGERKINENLIINPGIFIADTTGKLIDTYPIPPNLVMQVSEAGPRRNGTLEGLAFAGDFKTLYVSMEEPLHQDGPRASLSETDSWVRFYEFDVTAKKNIAQYAYRLEPIAYPSVPEDSFKMNGVSEILSLGSKKLLVIERSYSTGHPGCTIKVFLADLRSASDVKDISSLKGNPPDRPIAKKLLLNMESLPIYIDNVEGVTFGPDFPNGHKSLIFVTDDNFSHEQKTQFLLFEVIP